MRRVTRISIGLPPDQLQQVHGAVESGEFRSRAQVIREAVRAWLHRRALHAGRHGLDRFSRSFEARRDPPPAETSERVELMFDAGDAKA